MVVKNAWKNPCASNRTQPNFILPFFSNKTNLYVEFTLNILTGMLFINTVYNGWFGWPRGSGGSEKMFQLIFDPDF